MTIPASPSPLKIGLVLSGGGGKGSYQAGVFRALEELGARPLIRAISGCSIGALNALLLLGGTPEMWRSVWVDGSLWRALTGPESEPVDPARLRELTLRATRVKSLDEYLSLPSLLPQENLRRFITAGLDPRLLDPAGVRVSVCAYQLEAQEPRYFWLDELSFSDAVDITVASTAIPVVFPPSLVGGFHYNDGGMTPPYSRKNNGDKTPVLPLAGLGLDLLLVIYLNHYDRLDRSVIPPGTALLELYPSRPLEENPGARTMDFDSPEVAVRWELGYRDALRVLPPILEAAAGGADPAPLLAELDAQNAALLAREQAANRAVAARARRVQARLAGKERP